MSSQLYIKASCIEYWDRMGTARSTNMAVTCLKPSEYRGDQNTAVAGRIMILKHQEIQSRKGTQAAAAPSGGRKGKGGKAAKGLPETRTLRKLEAHIAATQSLSEVLYVEAWGENGDKLAQKCQVGDVVSIQGAAVVSAPAQADDTAGIERQKKPLWSGTCLARRLGMFACRRFCERTYAVG